MSHWQKVLALSVGGALGANARYWLGLWVAGWAGIRFPWPTLLINVTGAFALGLLATAIERRHPSPSPALEAAVLCLLVGGLGGYTTFSTFTLEALRLWRSAAFGRAAGYVLASLALGLLAAVLGALLARILVPRG